MTPATDWAAAEAMLTRAQMDLDALGNDFEDADLDRCGNAYGDALLNLWATPAETVSQALRKIQTACEGGCIRLDADVDGFIAEAMRLAGGASC